MHIKSIVSAATLAIALGFAGTAAAQTMIGNQNVSEADMERVKVYCEDLQSQENAAVGTDPTPNGTEETNDTDAENSTAAVGSVDMTAITVETCLEAGFIENTVN